MTTNLTDELKSAAEQGGVAILTASLPEADLDLLTSVNWAADNIILAGDKESLDAVEFECPKSTTGITELIASFSKDVRYVSVSDHLDAHDALDVLKEVGGSVPSGAFISYLFDLSSDLVDNDPFMLTGEHIAALVSVSKDDQYFLGVLVNIAAKMTGSRARTPAARFAAASEFGLVHAKRFALGDTPMAIAVFQKDLDSDWVTILKEVLAPVSKKKVSAKTSAPKKSLGKVPLREQVGPFLDTLLTGDNADLLVAYLNKPKKRSIPEFIKTFIGNPGCFSICAAIASKGAVPRSGILKAYKVLSSKSSNPNPALKIAAGMGHDMSAYGFHFEAPAESEAEEEVFEKADVDALEASQAAYEEEEDVEPADPFNALAPISPPSADIVVASSIEDSPFSDLVVESSAYIDLSELQELAAKKGVPTNGDARFSLVHIDEKGRVSRMNLPPGRVMVEITKETPVVI